VTGNQLEEQLHGAAERRRRHDEGHDQTLLPKRDSGHVELRDESSLGMQPVGHVVHIGNYLGALKQWVEAQSPDAFYCVVDLPRPDARN